jgi:protein-disulfide isomerase
VSAPLAAVADRDHTLGRRDASMTLVQYGDYQCPYTRRSNAEIAVVRRELGPGLLFVFRHFPLAEIHPHAVRAALAAESASRAGAFWPMHDALFARQHDLSDEGLAAAASSAGADPAAVLADVEAGAALALVREDFDGGTAAGVLGTPTFFVNGLRHDGGYGAAELMAGLRRGGAEFARPAADRASP